ncbi:phasin family protein [Qipengyuania atrilutea]|uniref:Phasin family protein n=1 Tax=Qipengyuania atrilutea TaxID=2744473 RepID=A0A850H3A6_9SPHN|nr:phasin family protein [Actirhodobacter atriluteus]NVD45047.1 phasin family protein [Actirhodobacter atriluteus]
MATAKKDNDSKTDGQAEKAYAEAATEKASAKKVAEAIADSPVEDVAVEAVADAVDARASSEDAAAKDTAPAKKTSKKQAPQKPAAPKPAKIPPMKKSAAKKKAAPAPEATPAPEAVSNTKPEQTTKITKDTIMATAPNIEMTSSMQDAAADMQARMKTAYEKTTEVASEMTEFGKGNVEALVESSKVFTTGMQNFSRMAVEDTKSAYETMTDDVKKMAAAKSPTELMQLQGEIARRNFDTAISQTSKNTEMLMKLVNDTFAPVSNRVSVAVEKVSKAA